MHGYLGYRLAGQKKETAFWDFAGPASTYLIREMDNIIERSIHCAQQDGARGLAGYDVAFTRRRS